MNRVSHMVFAFALFVGLYSLIYGFTVFQDVGGSLPDLLFFYIAGGIGVLSRCQFYTGRLHTKTCGREQQATGAQ
jgi:uncharacterized membrane protein